MKTATTIEEQIALLKSRGMIVPHDEKAKEILLDIGYYRLGFYWFPYEKDYPSKSNRKHEFKEEATFDKVVSLYYFDHDLRTILSPYLYRIEVNFRTYLIYTVSNKYKNKPTWFADPKIVSSSFITHLAASYFTIQKNDAIKHHHKKYPNDIYAPAWKTLEYMTFGDILVLYSCLKDQALKKEIAMHYNIRNTNVFENYMGTIRILRNLCAHGHNIYDLKLQKSIKAGPITEIKGTAKCHNLAGCLLVISYILKTISVNRDNDLKEAISRLLYRESTQGITNIIEYIQDFN